MTTRYVRFVAGASVACLTLLSTPSDAQQGTQEQVAPPATIPVAVFVFSNVTGEAADDWMGWASLKPLPQAWMASVG